MEISLPRGLVRSFEPCVFIFVIRVLSANEIDGEGLLAGEMIEGLNKDDFP